MTKAKKRFTIIAACVAAVAVGAVLLGSVNIGGNKDNAEEIIDSRVLVDTLQPERGDIVIQGEFIGTVDPNRQVTVYPKAAGEILTVNFDVGDYVEAGDVLCELDSQTLLATIKQSQAALASAQAKANYNLAIAENDLETQQFNAEQGFDANLNRADATIEQAESGVKNAQAALDRAHNGLAAANASYSAARRKLRMLRDGEDDTYLMQGLSYDQAEYNYKDAVAQTSLAVDAAEIGVESAKQALEDAKSGLKQAKEGARTTEMATREAQIVTEERIHMAKLNTNFNDQYIAIEKLQNDLKNYTVVAAISGFIEQRSIDPNDMASQQTPLFVIANKDNMVVNFNVSEAALANMKLGDTVTIDKNGTKCTGTVTEISSSVDARSGLFTIKASIANPPSSLYSGSTVKVFADTQKAENYILVPIDAIYYQNGKPYVYVAENGIARIIFIETGISDDKNMQVLSGITANDTIITTWNSHLADGAAIKLSVDELMTETPASSSEEE